MDEVSIPGDAPANPPAPSAPSSLVSTPPPPGVGGRGARIAGLVLRALWVALFIAFHVWNFTHYSPVWGYDGPGHIRVLQIYHATGHAPPTGYGASNPPLYYVLAGALWGLAHSIKVVQAMSLALFCCNVWIVKRLIWSATRNQPLRWASLTLVAYLPVHVAYAYMVFNYSLAHTEELAAIYCLYMFARRPRMWRIIAAGVFTSLGVLTALINLYLVPLGAFAAFVFGPRPAKGRLLCVGAFILAIAGPLVPYYIYRQGAQGCFFCTAHRSATNKPLTQVYPPTFYASFTLRGLAEPYYPHHIHGGLWNLVYETAFGDYFGYLVPERLTDTAPDHRGLVSTGRHFLDAQRQRRLAWLNFLALPAAIALLAALAHAGKTSFDWIRRIKTSRPPPSLLIVGAAVLALGQFLVYIHKYPNYVNIHAGYVLIVFLLSPIELARMLKSRLARVLVEGALFAYAAGAYWVFLLR